MRWRFFIFIVAILFAACQAGKPGYVIGEREMEAVLYDYHVAQAIASQSHDSVDYRRYAYVQKVFEKHGITEAQFDTSMVWYTANAGELFKIYKRLYDRLDAEAAQAGAAQADDAFASLTADGDTANIWMGQNMLSLLQASQSNSVSFAYVADSTFRRGDEFLLRGAVHFLQRDGARDAVLALCLHYDGDSVMSTVQSMRGDGDFNLRLTASKQIDLKGISGFVYFPTTENRNNELRRMFVFRPMLVRIHHIDAQTNEQLVRADKASVDSLKADSLATDSLPSDTANAKPQPAKTEPQQAKTGLQPLDKKVAPVPLPDVPQLNETIEPLHKPAPSGRNHKTDSIRNSLRQQAKRNNAKTRLSPTRAPRRH